MKTLIESIFDDNLASRKPVRYAHDVPVDEKVWEKCEKMFEWFRKDIVGDRNELYYNECGSRGNHTIIYNEKDCIIMIDYQAERITFISPEVIYYNFVKGSLDEIITSGHIIPDRPRKQIYCMTFCKRFHGEYYALEYQHSNLFGYTPDSISKKAQKIINNY